MPRFLLTFLFILTVSLAVLVHTVIFSSPEKTVNLVSFFAGLFFFLFSLASIFLYFTISAKIREPLNRKSVFRRYLFLPCLVSSGVVVIGLLKIFGALNPFNLVLLLILLVLLAFYLAR